MARSNESQNVIKEITPINNARYFKCVLSATQDKENLKAEVYYTEPDRSFFPSDESYQIALDIFKKNEAEFDKAKDSGVSTTIYNNNGKTAKKFAVDLSKKLTNGNIVQAISGRLLNFYSVLDTFNDGKSKQKWVADLFDFSKNERYIVEITIATVSRKWLDAITSLTSEQLKHNIELAFVRYEYKGQQKIKAEVNVLDPNSQYGRVKVEQTFEKSQYNEKTMSSIAIPSGSKSDNEEFIKALNGKIEDKTDSLLVKFYKRIAVNFQENVLLPSVKEMFNEMGFNCEIKDETVKKNISTKQGTKEIEEKVREVVWLTPKDAQNIPNDSSENKPDEGMSDDLPF